MTTKILFDQQLTTLTTSIEHWKTLHKYTLQENAEAVIKEGWYARSCMCCIAFYDSYDYATRCDGCPIKEFMNAPGCSGTPWRTTADLLEFLEENLSTNATTSKSDWINTQINVEKEIKFLERVKEKLLIQGKKHGYLK